MDEKLKLQKLWNYLEVQDDENLIVQSYNHEKGSDEFFVVGSVKKRLEITTANSLQELKAEKPFILVQQIDSTGKHIIPSVEQLKHDELIDY